MLMQQWILFMASSEGDCGRQEHVREADGGPKSPQGEKDSFPLHHIHADLYTSHTVNIKPTAALVGQC